MQLEIVSLALLSSVTVVALTGRMLSSDIIGYLGVRYGRAPVRTYRFEKSIPLHLNESEIFDQWPKRCPSLLYELELDEDCLFFSLLQHNSVKYRVATLLIVTNDKLGESKLLGIVSSTLSVIVASVRDGVLGSLGDSPFSVSDVISLSVFLQSHSNILNIGPITVCAVGSIAETISASLPQIDFARAILFNGNSHTRTKGRRKYSSRALYKLTTELMCDLPSVSQSTDCLRSKSLNEILSATNKVTASFYPFGDPFRSPVGESRRIKIPLLLGIYRYLPDGYPTNSNYDERFQYRVFKKFLTELIPDSIHRNAPLLRRLILHQYIHTKGDKRNTQFLFEQMRNIVLDRDFIVPTQALSRQLAANNNIVYTIEYEINNPITWCFHSERWEKTKLFCNKMIKYITQFAIKGQLPSTCDSSNTTLPTVELHINDTIDCGHNFHLESYELWDNLLPFLDTLELAGRRHNIFHEEEQIDPLEIEDDVQVWHEQTANNELEFEKELNGERHNVEL